MSNPINEAYARIDVGAIEKIQSDIRALQNLITTGVFGTLDISNSKTGLSIKAVSVYCERINVPANESKITVSFGTIFDFIPTVTATVRDSTGSLQDTDSVTILISKITRNEVEFFIKKKNFRCDLHVIAIGPKRNIK